MIEIEPRTGHLRAFWTTIHSSLSVEVFLFSTGRSSCFPTSMSSAVSLTLQIKKEGKKKGPIAADTHPAGRACLASSIFAMPYSRALLVMHMAFGSLSHMVVFTE